jgi:protein-tyrosine phosphatase
LLDQAVSWVEEHISGNRVMVCCRAGMGRSVSVVMAYLCCAQGMTYDQVFKLVMTRRPGATPLPNLEEAIAQVRLLREARTKGKKTPVPPTPPAHNHKFESPAKGSPFPHVAFCPSPMA